MYKADGQESGVPEVNYHRRKIVEGRTFITRS